MLEVVFEAVHSKLTLDFVSGTAHSGAVGTAALNHEAVDNAVKGKSVVESVFDEADKVVDGVGSNFGIKLRLNDLSAVHFECNNWI